VNDVRSVRYEPPRISKRAAIELPLVAFGSPGEVAPSASFRPV
jgi:hypothetical protein